MKKTILAGLGLALAMGLAPVTRAEAADLTIFHSWSNESEIKALNVYMDALRAKGHTIKELAVPHEQSSGGGPIVSLVIAGTPPNIFLTGNADIYRDIRDRGLGQTVGEHFDAIGATEKFPPACRRRSRSTAKSERSPRASISTASSTTT
ncbi:MAG: hypothetical protein HC871_05715 [Rhizobiales bacterium]|nr:hypothetical protein [Hyphomicrobiales bacterium]